MAGYREVWHGYKEVGSIMGTHLDLNCRKLMGQISLELSITPIRFGLGSRHFKTDINQSQSALTVV